MKKSEKLYLIENDMFKTEFGFEEVSKLMYATLLKKGHEKEAFQISRIGVVSGFVDVNDELEVIVKFMDGLEQYTKEEFNEKFVLMDSEGNSDSLE